MGLNLCKQFAHILISAAAKLSAKAKTGGIGTLFDDFFQPVERAAANKEDVGRINLDKFLLRMLPSAAAAARWTRCPQ